MRALFVLLPCGRSFDELFAALPSDTAALRARLQVRVYPPADDRAHLLSLVRSGRDPVATRWLRGLFVCIGAGSVLGSLTAAILAWSFAMFGGLVPAAIAFGAFVGAFLGGFTAAMTGTERARDEVLRLSAMVRRGDVLVSIASTDGSDAALLDTLRSRGQELGFECALRQ